MNNITKLLSAFAVILMIATPFACITDADGSGTETNAIESDDAVVLNIDKPFEYNEKQLSKLGITSPYGWTLDEERGCYRLTLDDVNFKTTSSVALALISTSASSNPKLVIELRGDNSLTSGYDESISIEDVKYRSFALFAAHYDRSGTNLEDITIAFTGDGSLSLANDVPTGSIRSICGIKISGAMVVTGSAKIYANAADMHHICYGTSTGEEQAIFSSVGIVVNDFVMVSDDDDKKPLVYATSGDATMTFTSGAGSLVTFKLRSTGILSYHYYIKNSILLAESGNVDWTETTPGATEGKNIYAESSGIGYHVGTKTSTFGTFIENSKIYGRAGDAIGKNNALSYGISFKSSDSEIRIKDSVISGFGGDSRRLGEETTSESVGVFLGGSATIEDSLIRAFSGEEATGSGDNEVYSNGLFVWGDLSVKGSIIQASSLDTHCSESYGIKAVKITVTEPANIDIADSEIFATGNTQSMCAYSGGKITIEGTPRVCCSVAPNGDRTTIAKTELGNNQCIILEFKYDVVIANTPLGTVGFERLDNDSFVLPGYKGYVPEGMSFGGYLVNGEKGIIGQTYDIDDPVIVTIVLNEKSGSGDSNNWALWVIAIVVILVVAAMIVGVYIYSTKK